MNETKEFKINKIESKHILNILQEMFDYEQKYYVYDKENLKTFAVTAHPHFTIWSCALVLAGKGGEAMVENATDEMFGAINEGPHSLLAYDCFEQFGKFNIQHYQRCINLIKNVYKYVSNSELINVLYAFIITIEVQHHLMPSILETMKQYSGISNYQYITVHMHADNMEDGHGVQMLKTLETDYQMTVELFNRFR